VIELSDLARDQSSPQVLWARARSRGAPPATRAVRLAGEFRDRARAHRPILERLRAEDQFFW